MSAQTLKCFSRSGLRSNRGHLLPLLLAANLGLAGSAVGQFVAFYDHAPGLFTHSNVVDYGLSGSGPLLNVLDGANTGVTLTVSNLGATYYPYAGVPNYGTPASIVFDGFVDFGGMPNPSISLGSTGVLFYTFSGLNPGAEYNFQGAGMRADWPLTNQWTLFQLVGAASFASAHSPGILTTAQVPALQTNEAALNSGNNAQGALVWWEHIRPGPLGTFTVICRRYTNAVPGGSSAGSPAWGMNGFRLEQSGTYSGRTTPPPRRPNLEANSLSGIQTVFVLMFENKDWGAILGSTNCPYINSLLPMASYCNQFYSAHALHPSEANYLWLLTGTNFGIRDDNLPSVNHQNTTNTLFHQLDLAGISWKSYQEDISGTNVPDTNVGQYFARHNPFVFFDEVRTNLSYCTNHVRPYRELASDLTNNAVPRFCFLTPNITNDMHSLMTGSTFPATTGELRQGDHWLSVELPKILASSAYSNGGAVFITWDESTQDYDGPFGMLVLSPRAKGGGYSNSVYYTHSATLRTFQNIFGLRPYLGDAAFSTDLKDLFLTIQLVSASMNHGELQVGVTNVIPNQTAYIDSSTNLVDWNLLQTKMPTGNSLSFIDSQAAPGSRFYRVRQ